MPEIAPLLMFGASIDFDTESMRSCSSLPVMPGTSAQPGHQCWVSNSPAPLSDGQTMMAGSVQYSG